MMIAREARSPVEFARRAEAWNAGEARPLPAKKLAQIYTRIHRRVSPNQIVKLIRQAHEQRSENRERMWTSMSHGLRDIGPQTRCYQSIRDGIKGLRRALDRGACRDAEVMLQLTEHAMRGVRLLKPEQRFFDDERARYGKSCRIR
jgi:hypothetical protein